jgi:hypothetical protein
MITNFKIFENENKDVPQVGDYVIMNVNINNVFLPSSSIEEKKKFVEFINNTIGEISGINYEHKSIIVKYHNVSFWIEHLFIKSRQIFFDFDQILDFDKSVEKLKNKTEYYFNSKKYNL